MQTETVGAGREVRAQDGGLKRKCSRFSRKFIRKLRSYKVRSYLKRFERSGGSRRSRTRRISDGFVLNYKEAAYDVLSFFNLTSLKRRLFGCERVAGNDEA